MGFFGSATPKSLHDGVAIITGAGGGIGRALALELAQHGCHLALVDISTTALAATAAQVAGPGVRVSQHVVDVTHAAQVEELAVAVQAQHGGVDFLFNNAGITLQKSFAAHSLADIERIVGINLWGVLYGCHYLLPLLRQSPRAHIVNLSSMAAFAGLPSQSTYCLTKAAVRAFSEALWAELAVDGIGVTCVHPGAVRTNMIRATLADSENQAVALRNLDLATKFGVAPQAAARKIIAALQHNRLRVRIGADAYLLDWIKRLLPVAMHYPLARLFRQQMR